MATYAPPIALRLRLGTQTAPEAGPAGKLRASVRNLLRVVTSLLTRKRSVAEPGQPRVSAGDPRGVGATGDAFPDLRLLGDISKVDARRFVALMGVAAPRYAALATECAGPLDAIAPAFREYLAVPGAQDAQQPDQAAPTLNAWGALLADSLDRQRDVSPQARAVIRAMALGWLQCCADAAANGKGAALGAPTLQRVLDKLIDKALSQGDLNAVSATLGLLAQVPPRHRPAFLPQTTARLADRASQLTKRDKSSAVKQLPQLLASGSNADVVGELIVLATPGASGGLVRADFEPIQAALRAHTDTDTTVAQGRAELLATLKYIAWCLKGGSGQVDDRFAKTLVGALGLQEFAATHGDDAFAGIPPRHKAQIAALVARLQVAATTPGSGARELSHQLYQTARRQLQSVEARRQVPAFNDPASFQSTETTARRARALRHQVYDGLVPTQMLHGQSLQNLAKGFVKYLRTATFLVNDVNPDAPSPLGITAHRQRMEWAALLEEDLGNRALPERKRGISRQLALAWLDAFAQGASLAAPGAADLRYLRSHGNCDTDEKLQRHLARQQLAEAAQAQRLLAALACNASTIAEREALITRLPALRKTASAHLRALAPQGASKPGQQAESLDAVHRLAQSLPAEVQALSYQAQRQGLVAMLKQRLLDGDTAGALHSAVALAMLAPPAGAQKDTDDAQALRQSLASALGSSVPASDALAEVARLLHYVAQRAARTPGMVPPQTLERLGIVATQLRNPSPDLAKLGADGTEDGAAPALAALLASVGSGDVSAALPGKLLDTVRASYLALLVRDPEPSPLKLGKLIQDLSEDAGVAAIASQVIALGAVVADQPGLLAERPSQVAVLMPRLAVWLDSLRIAPDRLGPLSVDKLDELHRAVAALESAAEQHGAPVQTTRLSEKTAAMADGRKQENSKRAEALANDLHALRDDGDQFADRLGRHVQRHRQHADLALDFRHGRVKALVADWMKADGERPVTPISEGATYVALSADTVNHLKTINLPAIIGMPLDLALRKSHNARVDIFRHGVTAILQDNLAQLRELPAVDADAASNDQRQALLAGTVLALLMHDELMYPQEQQPGMAATRLGGALEALSASRLRSDSTLAAEAKSCLRDCALLLGSFCVADDNTLPALLATRHRNLRAVCERFAPDTSFSPMPVAPGPRLRKQLGSRLGVTLHGGKVIMIAHTLPAGMLGGLFERMAESDKSKETYDDRGIAGQFFKDFHRTDVCVAGVKFKRIAGETDEQFTEHGCARLAKHCRDVTDLTAAVSIEMTQRLIGGFIGLFNPELHEAKWHAQFIEGYDKLSLPYSVREGEIITDTAWQDERYVDVVGKIQAPVSELFANGTDVVPVEGFYGLEYRVRIDRDHPNRWEPVGTPIFTVYATQA